MLSSRCRRTIVPSGFEATHKEDLMDGKRENRARILRSVEEWNHWRKREPSSSPDLSGTVFEGTLLNGAMLNGCILRDTQFLRATVNGTNFEGASLDRCIFVRVDLRPAVGLHLVQSSDDWLALDAWTLSWSRGHIPRILLLRAGLEGAMVNQFESPPEYHSCFVSYSSSDSRFVEIVVDRLTRCGVEVWRDLTHLEPGAPLTSTLTEEAKKKDFLLAVLSEKALQSRWTSLEWFSAEKILPVTLDQAFLRVKHPKIQDLKVLSFENWARGTILDDGIEMLLRRLRRSKTDSLGHDGNSAAHGG